MAVKESPKGSRRYVIEFEYRGERVHRRCPKGTNRGEAEVQEANLRKELFEVGVLGAEASVSLPGAIATWLAEVSASDDRRSHKSDKEHCNALADFVEGKLLSEVPAVAQAYRKHGTAKGLAPATINRRIAKLKAVATWAWKIKKLTKVNHSPFMLLTSEKKFARRNFLTVADVRKIVAKMPTQEGKAWVMLAAYCGTRQSELYTLPANKVRNGVIDLGYTKNGEPRMVPIAKPALPYVKFIPWTRTLDSLDWEWRNARDAAGFGETTTYHDLRHTFASFLINKKVDLFTIGRLLGNDHAYTTGRYAHLELDTLKAAVRKLA